MKRVYKRLSRNKAVRTFFQAFVGSIVVIAPTIDFTASNEIIRGSLMTLIISGIAAGISAVMNVGKIESI